MFVFHLGVFLVKVCFFWKVLISPLVTYGIFLLQTICCFCFPFVRFRVNGKSKINFPICMKDITILAWEHFRKLLLVNTLRLCIYKCKLRLYRAKWSQTSTTFRSTVDFSGPKLIWDGLMHSGKVFCGLTSPHLYTSALVPSIGQPPLLVIITVGSHISNLITTSKGMLTQVATTIVNTQLLAVTGNKHVNYQMDSY